MDWLEDKLRRIGKESFEQDYAIYQAYGTGQCSRVDAGQRSYWKWTF